MQWFTIRIKGLLNELTAASTYLHPTYNHQTVNWLKHELHELIMLLGHLTCINTMYANQQPTHKRNGISMNDYT